MSAAWNKNKRGQAKSDKLQEHLSAAVRKPQAACIRYGREGGP
jgi:hypothetical protein